MKRKTKKEIKRKWASQEGDCIVCMQAKKWYTDCKGDWLAQSQQVPQRSKSSTKEIVSLEAELKQAEREITDLKEKIGYLKNHYTVSTLDEDVLKIETGLATRDSSTSNQLLTAGWRVESMTFEDQIFITLMKVRQDHIKLHFPQLFSCSVSTIENIVTTFIHVIHSIYWPHDINPF